MDITIDERLFLGIACALWSLALGLLLIVLFPFLVRLLREATIAAAINRLTLFPDEEEEDKFKLLQVRALIYDCVGMREGVTLRLSKLREVYLALDLRGRPKRFAQEELERYGRKCLQELVSIVSREIAGVQPNARLDGPIVEAKDMLAMIANRDRSGRTQPAVHKASDLEIHFREHPLTIEQVGELLEAINYGLLFRRGAPSDLEPDDYDLLSDIIRKEQRLRVLVENTLKASIRTEEDLMQVLRFALGNEAVDTALDRAARSGEGMSVFDGLFLDQLKQIITKRWDLFGRILANKNEVVRVFEVLAPVRNSLAHGRRLTSQDRSRAWAGSFQIDAWLEGGTPQ